MRAQNCFDSFRNTCFAQVFPRIDFRTEIKFATREHISSLAAHGHQYLPPNMVSAPSPKWVMVGNAPGPICRPRIPGVMRCVSRTGSKLFGRPLVVAKRLWILASHKVAGSEGIPDLENGARRLRRLTVSDPAVWIISKSPDHLALKRECRAPPANCRSPNQDTTAWRSQLLNRRVVAFLVPNQFYEQTENHCLLETLLRLEPGRARRHAQIRFAF